MLQGSGTCTGIYFTNQSAHQEAVAAAALEELAAFTHAFNHVWHNQALNIVSERLDVGAGVAEAGWTAEMAEPPHYNLLIDRVVLPVTPDNLQRFMVCSPCN